MCPPDLPGIAADGAHTSSACTTSGQSLGGLAAHPLSAPGTASTAAVAAAATAAGPAPPMGAGSMAAPAAAASSGGSRPRAQRGPRPRLFKKWACQADACQADLSSCAFYLQRNHICPDHLKADSYVVRGVPSRFCQRCGQGHPLTEFDGGKRSCRKSLQKHNERRRVKQPSSTGSGGSAGTAGPAPAPSAAGLVPAMPPQLLPLRLGAPSLVTSAAAILPAPPPAPLPPPLPLQLAAQPLPQLGGTRCAAAAAAVGALPHEVAQARAQMEALRLTQQPNQWVLLPQRLLEQHVPQLLAAALTVGGLAQHAQQQAPQPLQVAPPPPPPLLVHAPLPAPRIRAPGSGMQYFSLLQGEFDGSGI